MEIKLKILAKDVKEANYLMSSDCPITRALARAGYNEYRDEGTDIAHKKSRKVLVTNENETYLKLSNKVVDLYKLKSVGNLEGIRDL